MQLSNAAESKLQAWLGLSTWHTSHDNDMERWYDFVDQYQRDHSYTIDEAALREHIEHKVEGGVKEGDRKTIRDRISLAYNILDFLRRSGR